MGQVLESSAERRLQAFRCELTLDLFTRHGRFWEVIDQIREVWAIVVEEKVPEPLTSRAVHLPPILADARLWPPQLEQVRPGSDGADLEAIEHLRRWRYWPGSHDLFVRWEITLRNLHDRVVPIENQVRGYDFDSAIFWYGFLSACLRYDPPADQLLEFADHAVASYEAFLDVLPPWANLADAEAPRMLAPPIRFLRDPIPAVEVERERHQRLLESLHNRLAPSGVDLWEMVYHIEYWERPDEQVESPKLRTRPYIAVERHTTESDVLNAYKVVSAMLPERPRPLKPRRDRLVSVQCALWYDEFGWSHQQIAEHFGWTIQHPPGAKPRSETARKHIADGRDLLVQRKPAA